MGIINRLAPNELAHTYKELGMEFKPSLLGQHDVSFYWGLDFTVPNWVPLLSFYCFFFFFFFFSSHFSLENNNKSTLAETIGN